MKPFFLNSEQGLKLLLPLVEKFSEQTTLPLSQCLSEVISSLSSSSTLVAVSVDKGGLTGYICGYFIKQTDFLVSQAFHLKGCGTLMRAAKLIEKAAKEMGAQRLLIETAHHPRVFRKYGARFYRYLLIKEV